MVISIILAIHITMLSQQIHIQADGWRGILPLRSSRKDVEQLIGPAYDATKGLYKTAQENIFIRYSEGPCVGSTGWEVPVDTVLYITVYPQPYGRIKMADLDLDRSKFKKEDDQEIPNAYYLINEETGITIYVQKDQIAGKDQLTKINYKPAARDKNFRCKL